MYNIITIVGINSSFIKSRRFGCIVILPLVGPVFSYMIFQFRFFLY